MRLPRILHRLYAWLFGYFWLPCPICSKYFGGHEAKTALDTSDGAGTLVCAECTDIALQLNALRLRRIVLPPNYKLAQEGTIEKLLLGAIISRKEPADVVSEVPKEREDLER